MSTDKRTGWLATIKPGDVVFYRGGGGFTGADLHRVKIVSVTPTGLMKTEHFVFDACGWERTGERGRSAWSRARAFLVEATIAVRNEYTTDRLRYRIEEWARTELKTATLVTLRAVAEALPKQKTVKEN